MFEYLQPFVERFEIAMDRITRALETIAQAAERTTTPTPVALEDIPAPPPNLLYAAEIAVNTLREMPGGYGYEIDLLTDAIRQAGGYSEGRDAEGELI